MAAEALSSSYEQSAVSSGNNSFVSNTSGVPITLSRSRRRPTRYSPEPIISNASNSGIISHQQNTLHQLVDADGNDQSLSSSVNGTSIEKHQSLLVHHRQQEIVNNNLENGNGLVNGNMAPAAAVAPNIRRSKHKPKRKYKKRSTNTVNHVDDVGKRPRVANVLLENEILIDEIKSRKALWMRTHEQYHSSLLTAPQWDEIAKVLDTTRKFCIFFSFNVLFSMLFFFFFYCVVCVVNDVFFFIFMLLIFVCTLKNMLYCFKVRLAINNKNKMYTKHFKCLI